MIRPNPALAEAAPPADEAEPERTRDPAPDGAARPARNAPGGTSPDDAPDGAPDGAPDARPAAAGPGGDTAPDEAAVPDPFEDADALEELEHEVVTLAAHIHAATLRLLELIAEFDRRRGWRTLSRADEAALERELWRLRRLSVVPDADGTYVVRGRLPAEVGTLLMRAVEAASDALFTRQTREETTPAQRRADALGLLAERALWAGFGGAEEEPEAHEEDAATPGARGVAADAEAESTDTETDDDGAAAKRDGPASGRGAAAHEASSARARGEDADEPTAASADGASEAEAAAAAGSSAVPISGTRAERYQVFLHVDRSTLDPTSEPGRSHVEDGTHVSSLKAGWSARVHDSRTWNL